MTRQTMTRWFGVQARCACLVLTLLTLAAGPAQAAGLLLADGGFGGQLEIVSHDVRVLVDNGIAVTEVDQVFRNLEDRIVEALYVFPVPEDASVADFSMWIGGKEMTGEVVEKERARQIYESYKTTRRDPGLLEQVDHKRFELRVFPIAAGAEQRMRITYYQELDVDHDWATWVYPLATVTEPGIRSRTSGRFGLSFDVRSEIPIGATESSSHGDELVFAKHSPHVVQGSLELDRGDLGRDVVIAYRLERPTTGFDVVSSAPGDEDGYFLLTLTLGQELEERRDEMDFVFVLDVSGSMNEDGKLSISRDQLMAFVDTLAEGDRFEVMAFNVMAQPLFGELRGVDPDELQEAETFLASQRAKGGTFLRPALETAFRYKAPDRPLNIVILSDGMTEVQERTVLLDMIARRPRGASIFAVGVGNEVDRPMLEQLTESAGGMAAFLSRGDDFDRRARSFRRKLTRPAATNVEIELLGADAYDLEPRQVPALFHGSPLRLYGRYRQPGPATVRLTADVGGERIEREVAITLPESGVGSPEIERMWAWHRVDRLLKEAERVGSRDGVVDEIVRLGEAYSIVTEHTSFLVLENDAEYRRWKIDRRNALRLERDRRRQADLRRELESMRRAVEPALGPVDDAADKGDDQSSAGGSADPRPLWNVDSGRSSSRRGSGPIGPVEAAIGIAVVWLAVRRRGVS